MFDDRQFEALEGVRDFAIQLLDIKCNMKNLSVEQGYQANPDFTKPIIAILNTKGKIFIPNRYT